MWTTQCFDAGYVEYRCNSSSTGQHNLNNIHMDKTTATFFGLVILIMIWLDNGDSIIFNSFSRIVVGLGSSVPNVAITVNIMVQYNELLCDVMYVN